MDPSLNCHIVFVRTRQITTAIFLDAPGVEALTKSVFFSMNVFQCPGTNKISSFMKFHEKTSARGYSEAENPPN